MCFLIYVFLQEKQQLNLKGNQFQGTGDAQNFVGSVISASVSVVMVMWLERVNKCMHVEGVYLERKKLG